MADRIYLNSLVDYEGNQYLPIMDRAFAEINGLGFGVYNIYEFDDNNIICNNNTNIYVLNKKTMAIYKKFTPPVVITGAPGKYPIYFEYNTKKVYYTGNDGHLYIYNFNTETLEDITMIGENISAGLTPNCLIVDEGFLYIYGNSVISKVSLTTFTEVGVITGMYLNLGSMVIVGEYIYAIKRNSYSSKIVKHNKTDLALVATSDMLNGTSSIVANPIDIIYLNGSLYVSDLGTGGTNYCRCYKFNANTLELETYIMSTQIRRFHVAKNGNLFATYSTDGQIIELDENTLMTKNSYKNSTSEIKSLYYEPTEELLFLGNTTTGKQIAVTYTINSYKKVH